MHWETKKFLRLCCIIHFFEVVLNPTHSISRYAYAAHLRLFYPTTTKKYFIKLYDFE